MTSGSSEQVLPATADNNEAVINGTNTNKVSSSSALPNTNKYSGNTTATPKIAAASSSSSSSDRTYPVSEYEQNLTKVLFTPEAIANRVRELGLQISADYHGQEVVVVGLLRGAFMFMSDLCRYITVPHEIDFMVLSSYIGTHTSHNVKISHDLSIDVFQKHVLIVEDLIDTGTTLAWLQNYLKTKNALSIKLCCLLDKKIKHRTKKVDIDYIGFECPDVFIVGYGMDYNQHYRSMPCIGVLNPSVYNQKPINSKPELHTNHGYL